MEASRGLPRGISPGIAWSFALFAPPVLATIVPFAIELLHIPMIEGFGNILWPAFFVLGVAGVIYAAYHAVLPVGVKILAVTASIAFLLLSCFLSLVIFFGVMMKL